MVYAENITVYRCECDECGIKAADENGFDFDSVCEAEIAALERGFRKDGRWIYCPKCAVGRDIPDAN